nr:PAS domain S-box protein [Ardenticatena sp.]
MQDVHTYLDALGHIGTLLIRSARWRDVAAEVARCVAQTTHAQTVTIVLNQYEASQAWRGAYAAQYGPEHAAWPWQPPLPSHVAKTLERGDVWRDPPYALVPLVLNEKWIGVLALVAPTQQWFSPADEQFAVHVAHMLAEAERRRRESLVMRWDALKQDVPDRAHQLHMYANVADALFLCDQSGRIVDANLMAQVLLGRSIDELQGASLTSVWGLSSFEERTWWQEIRTTLQQTGRWIRRFQVARPDGTILTLEATVVPLDNSEHILVIAEDVSDVAQAFERLRASENRYRALVEYAPDIVFAMRSDGTLLTLNPAFETLTGWDRDEWIGKNVLDLVHEDDTHLLAEAREYARQRRIVRTDVRLRRRDGAYLFVEITAAPERVGDAIVVYHGIARDITQRIAVEQELRSQRRLFRNLAEIARATSRRPSLEATLHDMLDVACSATGAARGSLFLLDRAGRVTHSILAREQADEEEKIRLATRAIKSGVAGLAVRERQVIRIDDIANDPRWEKYPNAPFVEGSALAVPISHDDDVLGVMTLLAGQPHFFSEEDVALMSAAADQMALAVRNAQLYEEQRHLIRDLEVARDAAEAASRAKSAFLANISHELRTPLTVIIGYAEMLLEDAQELGDSHLIHGLERVLGAAQHLLHVVNDLLNLTKVEAGISELDIQKVDVHDLVESIVQHIEPLVAASTNRFSLEIDESVHEFVGDVVKLRQILLNLLSNAIKFTDDGEISLRVWGERDNQQEMLVFEVRDTGIGIASEHLQKLFDPFYQINTERNRKHGGTGLGLAISQRYAQLMGGRIQVASVVGEGAVFTVRVPAVVSQ